MGTVREAMLTPVSPLVLDNKEKKVVWEWTDEWVGSGQIFCGVLYEILKKIFCFGI